MEDLQGGTLALEHRYDLQRRAGEYALFSMYRGLQHPFDRPVWVKVCEAPHTFGAPEAYERIKRAVVDTARLDDPQVAAVVDFGDIDTHLPFVVTERKDGVSLEEYLEKHGTLSPDEALEIVVRVADIVARGHALGIVHGGIAPRWITIADDGVYLDHFALQPTMHEIRAFEGVILSADLLWALPPEQFGDDLVEHNKHSDVWALGALLYWMLSGVHPYLEDPTDTSEAVLRLRSGARPESLEELGFDPEVAAFVEDALAVSLDDRFADLDAFVGGVPRSTTKTTEEPREEQPVSEPTLAEDGPEQGSMGTALALALGIALLSNLGWFFYTTSLEPAAAAPELPISAPAILPVGVELETSPAGGMLMVLDGTAEREFGDTPMVIDPKSAPDGLLPLVVRKRGHADVRIDVRAADDGHRLIVHLPPDEGVAPE